ncbi:hypothetical protein Tco_0656417 [Tanacetum coccineum]|uniref:Uncharacterized protein n=1 Tax=Tanacetum coccineum TaxID=301880 RepID=A0ABQ4X8P4_9ASTR
MNFVDPSTSLVVARGGDPVKLFDVSKDLDLVVASAGDDKKISLWRKTGNNRLDAKSFAMKLKSMTDVKYEKIFELTELDMSYRSYKSETEDSLLCDVLGFMTTKIRKTCIICRLPTAWCLTNIVAGKSKEMKPLLQTLLLILEVATGQSRLRLISAVAPNCTALAADVEGVGVSRNVKRHLLASHSSITMNVNMISETAELHVSPAYIIENRDTADRNSVPISRVFDHFRNMRMSYSYDFRGRKRKADECPGNDEPKHSFPLKKVVTDKITNKNVANDKNYTNVVTDRSVVDNLRFKQQ